MCYINANPEPGIYFLGSLLLMPVWIFFNSIFSKPQESINNVKHQLVAGANLIRPSPVPPPNGSDYLPSLLGLGCARLLLVAVKRPELPLGDTNQGPQTVAPEIVPSGRPGQNDCVR